MKDQVRQQMEAALASYEDQYANAPETVEEQPCGWTFHPYSWYYNTAWTDEEAGILEKTQLIVATSTRDGLPHIYSVCNREEQDYRTHSIT